MGLNREELKRIVEHIPEQDADFWAIPLTMRYGTMYKISLMTVSTDSHIAKGNWDEQQQPLEQQ